MEMRGGFMRPPRERGGLIRPLVMRGRGVMGMERMRLGPPMRPGLMRGGPPVPFVGRGMVIPPHARPRGMGPVMLPRPPIPPPGPMGPLGPRGMLPRPILPPRPLGPDASNLDPSLNPQLPLNGAVKSQPQKSKDLQNKPLGQGQDQQANRGVNKIIKMGNRMNKGNPGSVPIQIQPAMQASHQAPLQTMHPASHHPQPLNQPNPAMNPHIQKPMHVVHPQLGPGGYAPQQQPQPHPMQHQPAIRGGRNGMHQRGRGGSNIGRGGLSNAPLGAPGNRTNLMMNRGGPNMPPRGGAPIPGRGNVMVSGPPPPPSHHHQVQGPPSSYAIPPPIISSQVTVKRGPPIGVSPIIQPKRIRYDSPMPANGYGQYQQQPPPQQVYSGYEAPPPNEVYSNAPPPVNIPQNQNYSANEYSYPSAQQSNSTYSNAVNSQYSSYSSTPTYSNYSNQTGYDQSAEYSVIPNQTVADPYGYNKSVPVDSYSYSNTNYMNSQSGYEDYSTGYVDSGGYAATVPDPSYGQSVGTYSAYTY